MAAKALLCKRSTQHLLTVYKTDDKDLDDLRMEGVTGLVSSGSKFSQGRSSYCPEPQAKVTLNICSRCARLQGDSLAPAGAEEEPAPHIPEQAVPDVTCPLPGVTEPLTAAELELQSSSQVSSPMEEGSRHAGSVGSARSRIVSSRLALRYRTRSACSTQRTGISLKSMSQCK
ncbi:uncharacterized protein C8orf34 homolog isoform X1 [Tachysurus ichikawai]